MNPFKWLSNHQKTVWLLTLAYMGVIFYLSHQPRIPMHGGAGNLSYLLHVIEYTVLGVLVSVSINKDRPEWLVGAALIGFTYGVLDEVHQFFIPGRVMSAMDVLSDGVGSIMGVWIARYFT